VDEETLRLRPPNKPRGRRHIPTLEGASHAICPRRSQSVSQAGGRLEVTGGSWLTALELFSTSENDQLVFDMPLLLGDQGAADRHDDGYNAVNALPAALRMLDRSVAAALSFIGLPLDF
jgi:hypothetical protein